MALVDPKTPPRKDLEMMCRGNQRLVKAFEKLFELIPSELNKGADDFESAQMTADNAAAQALLAAGLVQSFQQQVEMSALQPAFSILNQQTLDLSPRSEQITHDQILPSHEMIGCTNFNLEVM